MFETAEIGRVTPREEYKEQVPALRQELLELQQNLRGCRFPVIILFAGVDGAGKSETVNLLSSWMDPRWLVTTAYTEPSQEELERPEYWRYWRDLPERGRIGLFLSAWYSRPLLDRVYGKISVPELDEKLERVTSFEKALADDGALVVKFWMHLGKTAQKKRLKSLEKNPLLSWRVTETDWRHWRMYDDFVAAAERIVMKTSTGHALWNIVEGFDSRYRSLTVGTILRDAVRRQIADEALRETAVGQQNAPEVAAVSLPTVEDAALPEPDQSPPVRRTLLSTLDMTQAMGKKQYSPELKRYQGILNGLHRTAAARKVSALMLFEGWDAAGKGGAIRRVTAALDARNYRVVPFAAPTDEERAHHYLWRFWRHLGRAGRVTLFDRSWYGRVLVERVQGFATQSEWARAYAEINDFEEQLAEHGIVLVKFWIHITKDEQLRRFTEREATPWKRWKLTEEDWRNREKWDQYERAVDDMLTHTSTSIAPWTLIEGNDKRFARIKVLKTVCDRLQQALDKLK